MKFLLIALCISFSLSSLSAQNLSLDELEPLPPVEQVASLQAIYAILPASEETGLSELDIELLQVISTLAVKGRVSFLVNSIGQEINESDYIDSTVTDMKISFAELHKPLIQDYEILPSGDRVFKLYVTEERLERLEYSIQITEAFHEVVTDDEFNLKLNEWKLSYGYETLISHSLNQSVEFKKPLKPGKGFDIGEITNQGDFNNSYMGYSNHNADTTILTEYSTFSERQENKKISLGYIWLRSYFKALQTLTSNINSDINSTVTKFEDKSTGDTTIERETFIQGDNFMKKIVPLGFSLSKSEQGQGYIGHMVMATSSSESEVFTEWDYGKQEEAEPEEEEPLYIKFKKSKAFEELEKKEKEKKQDNNK